MTTSTHNIADNIDKVMQRIQLCAKNHPEYDTDPALLAVSKGQPVAALEQAYKYGLRQFGENYLQEALEKIQQLQSRPGIIWHFIGPIQSNKTRLIAENFQWAHTVDRLKIAERLNRQRPEHLPPLNICLQVNIDNDPNKSGVNSGEAADLARKISELPGLALRGLMTIPAQQTNRGPEQPFRAMGQLFTQLQQEHTELATMDTLSMGMSGDLEAAIASGSTMVRVGTDIFGPRQQKTLNKG